jgi:hypothetical protein
MGNFKKVFSFILVSFFVSTSWALNHQDEVVLAQKWASGFERSYPIIVIDRDVTNFLIKSNHADQDESKRFELIKDYFAKEKNINLTKNEFINLDPYMTTITGSALAIPVAKSIGGEYKFCAVFANAPNGNSQVETGRIVGFDQRVAYKDHPQFNYNNLSEKMTLEELYLFSLYHEVSHCLDEDFLVEMQKTGGDAHGIHEAESYAEILAYYALIPRLGKEVANRRAVYRTVYSRVVGEYLTTQPSYGNPFITKGGAIYNLGPYLYKAYESVFFQEVDMSRPLDVLAKEFVIEEVLRSREFHAVVTFLTSGAEKSNEQYKDWSFKDPELFYTSYMALVQYQEYTENILDKAFTLQVSPLYDTLPKLDTRLMCQMIEDKNLEGHLKVLDDYRSQINSGLYKISEITEVYKRLNNLSVSCADQPQQSTEPFLVAELF